MKKKHKLDETFKSDLKDAVKVSFKKGNVFYLAIGVLTGAAFGAVINSLAGDIIMNAIAKVLGVKGLSSLVVGATAYDANGLPVDGIKYGNFLSVLLTFVIISLFLFIFTFIGIVVWRTIKRRKALKHKDDVVPVAPPAPTVDELILQELKAISAKLNAPVANAETANAHQKIKDDLKVLDTKIKEK